MISLNYCNRTAHGIHKVDEHTEGKKFLTKLVGSNSNKRRIST